MIKSIKRILLPLGILLLMGMTLFFINQISGVYLMLLSFNSLLANVALVFMILSAIALISWPLWLIVKLPQPLKLPQSEQELTEYRRRLSIRLSKNKLLIENGKVPRTVDQLGDSLGYLQKAADKVIAETSRAVFLTTAVSQNGKLDAITILATQSRMIWRVAHIYYQRPSVGELAYLYTNVAGAALIASEIEDLDVSQQIEPILNSMLKNATGKSLPLIGSSAHVVMDSLLEGSTNAFLTLRVGNIAKKYCGANAVVNRKLIRKEAFTESASQLAKVISETSSKIVSGIFDATKKAGVDTVKASWEGIKKTGNKVADSITGASKKANPFGKRVEQLEEESSVGNEIS